MLSHNLPRPPIVLALLRRVFGHTLLSHLGGAMMLVGLALVAYSGLAYLGLAPGGYTSVPEPVALAGSVAVFAHFYPILSAAPLAAGKQAFLQWMWLASWR